MTDEATKPKGKKTGAGELPPVPRRRPITPPTEGEMPQRAAVGLAPAAPAASLPPVRPEAEKLEPISYKVPESFKRAFLQMCLDERLDQLEAFYLGLSALSMVGIDAAKEEFERRGGQFGKRGGSGSVRATPPRLTN